MQISPETELINQSPPSEILTLDVSGMKCAGCVAAVERQLKQQPGVISARVNLATEVATVECEPGTANGDALAQKLTAGGFASQTRQNRSQEQLAQQQSDRHRKEIKQQIWRIAIAGLLILLSGIGHLGHFLGTPEMPLLSHVYFHWGLATLALLFPGRYIIVDGWRSLWRNAPNMNALVGLGATTAYLASVVALLFPQLGWECFFDEPVMILGFILLGKTLEQQARYRAASTLQSLISLQPATARLVPEMGEWGMGNGELGMGTVEIPAARVKVGEFVLVLPGDKIPVDGEICQGKTAIDESMLTGESMPVAKQEGDRVSAGTLNQSGAIVVRATRTGAETTLAQIVKLVEDAQTRKAPIQNLADRVAGYFTYGVMAIASVTFLFWYIVGVRIFPHVLHLGHQTINLGHSASMSVAYSPLLLSLKLAIAVLVISCPCALGLATPTAILVGSGIGAERGLLLKGGDILERVHQLNTIVFDKTGTLTTGKPTVTDCIDNSQFPIPHSLLQLAATVESGANHPIAEAILQQAQKEGLSLLPAEDYHTEPGLGVSAVVEGKLVLVGNEEWLQRQGVEVESLPSFPGKTAVYVSVDGSLAGAIAVKDILREDAKATVDRLQKMGLTVVLLTGDKQEVAEAIALELGLSPEAVLAEVRPGEKAEAIVTLQAKGDKVAMVGDGINDAPALAAADVGIGMQAGTDVAVETADIVLMRDALMDVVESIRLSRATFNKIRQNLFWAFIYNIIGIPIAAGVLLPTFGILLNPAAAGALMAFSSVSVVSNSLLLRRSF